MKGSGEKKYGLIGCGISDSLSPVFFKAAYCGKYAYDLLDGKQFDPLFKTFIAGYQAVNVTSPFKEQAFAAADELSDSAELCGSANILLKLPSGKILADNSDFEGVTLSIISAYAMSDADVDTEDEDALTDFLADRTALIVGCGGAGRAAAAATVTLGYGKTILMNRTPDKAEAVREHLGEFYEDLTEYELEVRPIAAFPEAFEEADLVIYTIPEAIEGIAKIDKSRLSKDKFILEANYKTPCLDKLGGSCSYISGLNWLLNQAIISYEVFTGEAPDEEAMQRINNI